MNIEAYSLGLNTFHLGQCKTHSVGTNILNCKTVSEWIAIGETQCSVLDTELELQTRSLKVHSFNYFYSAYITVYDGLLS